MHAETEWLHLHLCWHRSQEGDATLGPWLVTQVGVRKGIWVASGSSLWRCWVGVGAHALQRREEKVKLCFWLELDIGAVAQVRNTDWQLRLSLGKTLITSATQTLGQRATVFRGVEWGSPKAGSTPGAPASACPGSPRPTSARSGAVTEHEPLWLLRTGRCVKRMVRCFHKARTGRGRGGEQSLGVAGVGALANPQCPS